MTRVLTTPTCMNKGMLSPQDLVITDLNGRQVAGDRKFSSELAMHLLFYRMRPDVMAICHAHPPTATGFAVAGRALNQALLPEVIVGLGQIPLGAICHAGHSGIERGHRTVRAALRCAASCQPWRGNLRPGSSHCFLSNGDYRAQREDHAGRGDGRRTRVAVQPGSREADGRSPALFCCASAGRRGGIADHV